MALERTGGIFSTLLVATGILGVTFALWMSLMIHSKLLSRNLKQFNSTVYDGVLFNSPSDLSSEPKLLTDTELEMKDGDVWCHSHRMYLLGDNSIKFPWYLPQDFPLRALESEERSKLMDLVKEN